MEKDPFMPAVETYRAHNMWHNRMQGEEIELSSHHISTHAISEALTWARTRK